MKPTTLKEAGELLDALGRLSRKPSTISESIAHSILGMGESDLRALARAAFRRSYRSTLVLIHAEFRRRRQGDALAA